MRIRILRPYISIILRVRGRFALILLEITCAVLSILSLFMLNKILFKHLLSIFTRILPLTGNGYIPTTCLREILRELDDQLTNEELDMMIEEIDSDGSGTVDFDGTFFLLFFSFLFFSPRYIRSIIPVNLSLDEEKKKQFLRSNRSLRVPQFFFSSSPPLPTPRFIISRTSENGRAVYL